ncbi:hypothetical protein E8E11_001322 [Didymella keratinophila]|nr:hypothetical protein E8E11_001322 [Didymella keratinophila]
MSLTHAQLTELHSKATQQLTHKLSRVPARVWPADHKPTISDIYGDTEYVYSAQVPPSLQIYFIFANYPQFVAQDFQVRKREGNTNVNTAIWYWQMDLHNSFSSRHWTSRFNIIMAHVVVITGEIERDDEDPLFCYLATLIDAFHESVIQQDSFEYKAKFLSLWATGRFDYISWGKEGSTAAASAIKTLSRLPREASGEGEIWCALGVHYVMYLESLGKDIEIENKNIVAEYLLENNLLVRQFASGSLGEAGDRAAEAVFHEPRIQTLLKDAPPVQKRLNDTRKQDMWMDPDETLEILQETDAMKKALAEEAEKRMQQAMQDMADLSTSSVVFGQ